MRVDESIEIEADDIHQAAMDILYFLEDTSKEKEIYFKGWGGFGASAALKAVAKLLRSVELVKKNPKLKFDTVIHIDCSLWKNRRALQKAIAEELKLPRPVMAIFDQYDGDDDFKGVDEANRREIDDVTKHIFMNLAGCRFAVIFHNGGYEYIDFFEFGIPTYGHLRSKVLWTFHGRFRPHVQVDDQVKEAIEKRTDVFLRAVPMDKSDESPFRPHGIWATHLKDVSDESSALSIAVAMQEEAREVGTHYLTAYTDPTVVLECILYMWAYRNFGSTGFGWGAHVSSYWVCDGVIRDGGSKRNLEFILKNKMCEIAGDEGGKIIEKMWQIADDLHSSIHLDWDLDYVSVAVPKFKWLKPSDRWIQILLDTLIPELTDCEQSSCSVLQNGKPQKATSLFIASLNGDKSSTDQAGTAIDATRLPSHMFKYFESLRIIQLSWCAFSFSVPPFLHCKNVKFLQLDHCKDLSAGKSSESDGGEDKDHTMHWTESTSRPRLWVLDLNHTNFNLWHTCPSMSPSELYFGGVKNWIQHHLHAIQLGELVKLGVTDDPVEMLPNLLQAKSLRTVILDGCVELKEVGPDVLPPSLESFSFFVGRTPTEGRGRGGEGAKVHTISLRCCTQLKGLFLKGLFKNLKMLDLSGTLLKTIDLSMVQVPCLHGLLLLGCHMLCSILWPTEKPILQELQIDTTHQFSSSLGSHQATASTWRDVINISVRDARLLGSLVPIRDHFLNKNLHIDISSPNHTASSCSVDDDDNSDSIIIATSGCSISKKQMALEGRLRGQPYVKDVSFYQHQLPRGSSDNAWMWDCPRAPQRDAYIKVEDRMQQETLRPGLETDLLCGHGTVLHMHDSVSISSIPFSAVSSWAKLLWCRVERCHRLDAVFCSPEGGWMGDEGPQVVFLSLQTLWASQLPVARSIWTWSMAVQPDECSFVDLGYVHVDNCPRLLHVLPLSMSITLAKLHTLEIVCCDTLTEIFPVPDKRQGQVIYFLRLRRLHLHELPALRCLSGHRMFAPNLETVRVRGCWSLRRLPAVSRSGRKPIVDCEKEWWDRLEWDGARHDHDASLYETRHPQYGRKARLLKGTLLR